jgi:TPP-dependent trihydroxycyclohexane-1,2-dione (THcHDO) dehydratase
VIVIDTDARRGTAEGGAWWDVAVTEAPRSAGQKQARGAYERARKKQALGA